MKFYGGVLSSTRKNWLNFGGDLGTVRWANEQKNTIIVVAYPDRGAGDDPEPFFFFLGEQGGSLSQPRLSIFTVGHMRAMICLGQGGLRSLSASSLFFVVFFEGGSLSPPRLNNIAVGNIGVMICLGQGGLRSLSVSSYYYYYIIKHDCAMIISLWKQSLCCITAVLGWAFHPWPFKNGGETVWQHNLQQLHMETKWQCHMFLLLIITSLAKEVMFLVVLVSLSVCLSVDNTTQKVMNGLGWNFMDGSWVVQGRTD